MAFVAGHRPVTTKPRLQIWPSGKVVCGSSSAEIKDVQSQLDAKELNDLLDFIVNEQNFYELTDEGIKKSIADAGEKIYIADAPTKQFRCQPETGRTQTKRLRRQVCPKANAQA